MPLQYKLGVVGNPIAHSMSPQIHQQFAEQLGVSISYEKFLIEPDKLHHFIDYFFQQGGHGLNITLPFKQQIIESVDQLTPLANKIQSVNTIFLDDKKQLIGDSTDGLGLLDDLSANSFEIKNKNILILGAGGSCRSVAYSMLESGAKLSVYNRTKEKSHLLVEDFKDFGSIDLFESDSHSFDGIINTTTKWDDEDFLKKLNLNQKAFVYDLNYGQRADDFNKLITKIGIENYADGKGMLISQAAYAFFRWTGKMPDTRSVSLD
ncbi:MAG: shikimate dehydrogenase [Gammaproteobacteria bacterium]|nr:shikimate dehydrogenase [Gammaproteobacteria bacterium]